MTSFGFTPSGSPLGRGRHKKAALRVSARNKKRFGHKPQGPTNEPNQSVPDKYGPYEKTFRTSGGQ